MKSFSNTISSIISRAFTIAIGILGFSACSSDQPLMYGMPTGTFEIKGVVSDEDDNPIEDADVRVTYIDMPSLPYAVANGLTDIDGKYSVHDSYSPVDSMKVVCIPPDDKYLPDSVYIKMHYVKDKNSSSSWYRGHAEETVNFRLKKTDKETED